MVLGGTPEPPAPEMMLCAGDESGLAGRRMGAESQAGERVGWEEPREEGSPRAEMEKPKGNAERVACCSGSHRPSVGDGRRVCVLGWVCPETVLKSRLWSHECDLIWK